MVKTLTVCKVILYKDGSGALRYKCDYTAADSSDPVFRKQVRKDYENSLSAKEKEAAVIIWEACESLAKAEEEIS